MDDETCDSREYVPIKKCGYKQHAERKNNMEMKCPKCKSIKTWSSNWLNINGCDDCGVQWGTDVNKTLDTE